MTSTITSFYFCFNRSCKGDSLHGYVRAIKFEASSGPLARGRSVHPPSRFSLLRRGCLRPRLASGIQHCRPRFEVFRERIEELHRTEPDDAQANLNPYVSPARTRKNPASATRRAPRSRCAGSHSLAAFHRSRQLSSRRSKSCGSARREVERDRSDRAASRRSHRRSPAMSGRSIAGSHACGGCRADSCCWNAEFAAFEPIEGFHLPMLRFAR